MKFMLGSFGSIVPDILLFYSKRWGPLSFEWHDYLIVMVIYAVCAGIVASIIPYHFSRDKRWNAFVVGLTLPIIIGGVISTVDHVSGAGFRTINSRGTQANGDFDTVKVPGTSYDLMGLY